jgi:hypothetical protein
MQSRSSWHVAFDRLAMVGNSNSSGWSRSCLWLPCPCQRQLLLLGSGKRGQPSEQGFLRRPTNWLGTIAHPSIMFARPSFDTATSTASSSWLLAKPLKLSKNFFAQGEEGHSSRLSISENASSAKTSLRLSLVMKAGTKKMQAAYAAGDELGYASTRVINMLDSSVSEGEVSPLKCHQKCAHKSPSPKESLKPSKVTDVPMIKGLTL